MRDHRGAARPRVEACRGCATRPGLASLPLELTAVDYFPREPAYEVGYHLCASARAIRGGRPAPAARCASRCRCRDDATAAHLVEASRNANCPNARLYDLLGIVFTGTPTCGASWMPTTGRHPLRKDYPAGEVPVKTVEGVQLTAESSSPHRAPAGGHAAPRREGRGD